MKRKKLTTESGSPVKRFPELLVLCGHPHRAGVQVALAHQDATQRDERARGDPPLLGPQEGRDRDVTAGAEETVRLEDDPVTQVVLHEDLVGLGEAELPGQARVLDRGEGRGTRAARLSRDQDDVRVRLGDAGGDRADPDLGHELHVDPRARVGVFEVVDELGEVLDRVDVVVRRRRDEPHVGRRVADARDGLADLVAWELTALSGLGALGHLDLQLVGVDEVIRGDPEPRRRHLLDRRAHGVAVGERIVADGVLAALSRVRLGSQTVHRDREGGVGLPGDRAEGHGPGGEALRDRLDGLHVFDRDRREVLEFEKVPKRDRRLGGVVDEARVLAVEIVVVGPRGLLEPLDGVRVVEMALAPQPPLVLPPELEVGLVLDVDVGGPVPHERLALESWRCRSR